MPGHPVPTIDIEPYIRDGEAGRDAVAGAVDAACRETGFFAIAGHGVPEQTVEDLRRQAVAFFAQPAERKRLVERPADRISRGWNSLGDRALAYSLGKDTPPDLQESFAMGPARCPTSPITAATGRGPSSRPISGRTGGRNSARRWSATTG